MASSMNSVTFDTLFYLIFPTTFLGKYCDYSHFTDDDTEIKLSGLAYDLNPHSTSFKSGHTPDT